VRTRAVASAETVGVSQPGRFTQAEIQKGIVWIGAELPQEFFLYGTPLAESLPA
jgi:hypothetical protein